MLDALFTFFFSSPIEHCLDTKVHVLWRIEICLNAFFIFHLIIRVSTSVLSFFTISRQDSISFFSRSIMTIDCLINDISTNLDDCPGGGGGGDYYYS